MTAVPTAEGTPTSSTAEADLIAVTGEVEDIGQDFIQVDGQIFQIVAGQDGTAMEGTPEVGDVVTVQVQVQADGTLVAISIVVGAAPSLTPTSTPEP